MEGETTRIRVTFSSLRGALHVGSSRSESILRLLIVCTKCVDLACVIAF